MEHYTNVHLDLDMLFVKNVVFLLVKSRDIVSIQCKAKRTKSDKRVQNGLKLIVCDYKARIVMVLPAFTDNTFSLLINWIGQELHVDLTTFVTDFHVTRAENAIRFVKQRVRCIQSETLFTKFLKMLTVEILRRVTVLINVFNKKLKVHPITTPSQILIRKKFKSPLFKIGKLVMTNDVTTNNATARSKVLFLLYIRPNNSGIGHIVF